MPIHRGFKAPISDGTDFTACNGLSTFTALRFHPGL